MDVTGDRGTAELGVADALADGPQPMDELADRVGADPDALARLLQALASRGVFRQCRDGRYELNSLAGILRRDASPSMAGAARFYLHPQERHPRLARRDRRANSA
ncbi:MAG: methyltransferase family protein [Mycobacterium sp.]